jgi:hypothetical protein
VLRTLLQLRDLPLLLLRHARRLGRGSLRRRRALHRGLQLPLQRGRSLLAE